jgi:hypothetical protein
VGRSRAQARHGARWQADCAAARLRGLRYMPTEKVRPVRQRVASRCAVSGVPRDENL